MSETRCESVIEALETLRISFIRQGLNPPSEIVVSSQTWYALQPYVAGMARIKTDNFDTDILMLNGIRIVKEGT